MRVVRDENIDDGVYLGWKNRLEIYIDMLEEKIWSISQERQGIVNVSVNI